MAGWVGRLQPLKRALIRRTTAPLKRCPDTHPEFFSKLVGVDPPKNLRPEASGRNLNDFRDGVGVCRPLRGLFCVVTY